jgi:hypothetical protein
MTAIQLLLVLVIDVYDECCPQVGTLTSHFPLPSPHLQKQLTTTEVTVNSRIRIVAREMMQSSIISMESTSSFTVPFGNFSSLEEVRVLREQNYYAFRSIANTSLYCRSHGLSWTELTVSIDREPCVNISREKGETNDLVPPALQD